MIIKLKNKLFDNVSATSSYLTIAVTILVGFLILFVVTKYGGIDIYGQYIILKSTAGLLSGVLSFRTGEAVTKFYKRESVKGNFSNAKLIIYVGLTIDVIISFFILLAIYMLSPIVSNYFLGDKELEVLFSIFGLTSFFAYLRGTMIGFFQAEQCIVTINKFVTLESVLIALGLIFSIIKYQHISLLFIVYIHVLVYALITFFMLIKFTIKFMKVKPAVKSVFNRALIHEYLEFSTKTFFSSLLKAGNQNLDNLLIASIMTASDVGVYQVLKKIFSIIQIISQPWTMLSYSHLVHLFTDGKIKCFKAYINHKTKWILFFSCLIGGVLLTFIADLIQYLDSSIVGDYRSYGIVFLMGFIFSTGAWWSRVFSNIVNPNLSIKANAFSLVFQMSISTALIYNYGVFGAVISFLMLNLILLVYWSLHYRKLEFIEI